METSVALRYRSFCRSRQRRKACLVKRTRLSTSPVHADESVRGVGDNPSTKIVDGTYEVGRAVHTHTVCWKDVLVTPKTSPRPKGGCADREKKGVLD